MRKIALLLILFGVFIVSSFLMADEEHHLNFKNQDPTQESSAKPTNRDNFDSWESDRRVKQNFPHTQTLPIYHDDRIDVEIGAGIEFRFAL